MAFTEVIADDRSIYAVSGDNGLLWYRDLARDGTNGPTAGTGWARSSGNRVGTGWVFKHLFAGGDGIIYAITPDGRLLWYQDELRDGTNLSRPGWAAGSGSQIGSGWQTFTQVFSGGGGVIYAITPDGRMLWYRDDLRDGTNGANAARGWARGSGSQIDAGWQIFTQVFSGGNGVIYATTADGRLRWYRDDLRDGTNGANGERGWAVGSGNQIGLNWTHPKVFSPGDGSGIIYALAATSDLLWFRDTLRDGTNGAGGERGWAANSGAVIGLGWALHVPATLEGYPVPISVSPGSHIGVSFHSDETTAAQLQVFRLRENTDGSVGVPVGSPVTVTIGPQLTPSNAWQNGCGWPTTATLPTDPTWRSGIYSVRCTTQFAQPYDAVFVIRPGDGPPRDFLVLANTNCWNAYNVWGGRSNYSVANSVGTLSFERPNPETVPDVRDGPSFLLNHLTAAEIWVLTWLENNGYGVDVCSDHDFHLGEPDPGRYKGIVLSTHPEYWTQQMAARLQTYLADGGNVLYLGGNGVFRSVEYDADARAMTTGNTDPWHCGNAWPHGPKPRSMLGVAYDLGHDSIYPLRGGYIIEDASHRFFAGTGLNDGDLIGRDGRNGGGACGWEVDTATDFGEGNGPPPNKLQILARGQVVGANQYSGHMTYYEAPGGGFVFAIASITFGGSLVIDGVLQQVLRNALNACLA